MLGQNAIFFIVIVPFNLSEKTECTFSHIHLKSHANRFYDLSENRMNMWKFVQKKEEEEKKIRIAVNGFKQ